MTTNGNSLPQPPPPKQHIVMCAFPFGSHAAALYSLARALAYAAPEAIFSFVSTAGTLLSLQHTANVRLVPFKDGAPDDRSSAGVLDRMQMFFAAAPDKIRAAVKAAEAAGEVTFPVTCVVSDAFMWMAESVAEEMRVPWVAFFHGFILSLLAHLHTDDLRIRYSIEEEQAMEVHADELLDFIPGRAGMRVRDLPDGIIYGGINTSFSLHLHEMVRRLPRAAAVILVTLPGLEQDSTFFDKLNTPFFIGPLNLLSPPLPIHDKEDCLPWLDSQAASSVVYISFGSFCSLPPSELAELAYGLEESGAPFLWSLKQEFRSGLPTGFLERTRLRGKLVSWAPQQSVLSHAAAGVFVTQGGMSSTFESITAGVVMLCRPILGDQKMIARAVEELWGIGKTFDVITRKTFAAAMNAVLEGDDGKRMRDRALELKERTREAVLPGGSLSENFEELVEFVCRR